jgi:recombination protein U
MALERRINKANLAYRKKKLALIEKIELEFKITKTGMLPLQSTVDYKGMVRNEDGVAIGIAFDAKETKSKTSFPLANVEAHQIEYLRYVQEVGGRSFLLIHFMELYADEAFLTPITFILDYWDKKDTGPKSIKVDAFDKTWLTPIDDYLKLL